MFNGFFSQIQLFIEYVYPKTFLLTKHLERISTYALMYPRSDIYPTRVNASSRMRRILTVIYTRARRCLDFIAHVRATPAGLMRVIYERVVTGDASSYLIFFFLLLVTSTCRELKRFVVNVMCN